MLALLITAFVAAAITPALHRALRHHATVLLALVPLAVVGFVARHLPLAPGEALEFSVDWVPSLDIALAFRLDGLAATFALLIGGIGALILLYARGYLHGNAALGRLTAYLLFFLGAMLGVVLSDDVFVLFVFWELTSVSSYLLIGFKHDKPEARAAARQALLVTGAGGLALLAGLVLLVIAAVQSGVAPGEATRISALVHAEIAAHPLQPAALLLIVIGALAKSAQMPLHFWLPNAMAAPTPVSAYLHSATMVKAGVYLLARFSPLFGDSALWHLVLTSAGALTMLLAAGMAAGQRDLKRILAYTTVSVLGTLTMLIGVGTELAVKAAVVYLVAHACYKAALFMIAGNIEHATGTRDVRAVGGLLRWMPLTAGAGLLASLSMAGAPPLFGFIGKELLLKAKLDLDWLGVVLILVATLANIFLVAMALVVACWPFYRRASDSAAPTRRVPLWMQVGPAVLAVAGLFVGIVPDAFDSGLGSATASSIAGETVTMKLKLWHGVSPLALTALAISVVTMTLGFLLFLRLRHWLEHIGRTVARLGVYGPARGYTVVLEGLMSGADRLTRRLQTGRLRHYVLTALIALIAVCIYPLACCLGSLAPMRVADAWYDVVLVALTGAGALVAIVSRSRLAAIALLGITGLLIAVLFAVFSAPDLAMTQILVETLIVVLLVLVFYRLPMFARLRAPIVRTRDAVVATSAGAIMTAFTLAVTLVQMPATVGNAAAQTAKPEAYGRNVVNVILVDFRALDTLGEITVVALAGVGVYALLKLLPKRTTGEPSP